jgi:hypothetical protein
MSEHLGSWAVGLLGTWLLPLGLLSSRALGHLGTWALRLLGTWALGHLGSWALVQARWPEIFDFGTKTKYIFMKFSNRCFGLRFEFQVEMGFSVTFFSQESRLTFDFSAVWILLYLPHFTIFTEIWNFFSHIFEILNRLHRILKEN